MRNITKAKYINEQTMVEYVIENDLGGDNKIVMTMIAPVDEQNPDYQEIQQLVKAKKLKIEK